jgi:anthranilate phosphoribosyltransferase
LGLKTIKPSEIFGGDSIKEAANLFVNIIDGKGTEAQNNVVCTNAGLAIATSRQIAHSEGFELAKESLLSGKAKQSLYKLIALSK